MGTQDTKQVELALGRIWRMAARPTQAGDVAEYERCRALIINTIGDEAPRYEEPHNIARDYGRGAQGQW